ncbi:MAG TPA: hypothetical protein VGN42_18620, partial [Pirellulales bacterium]|nr:hypothetical protein [Pirellulales bacterium]
TTPDPASLVVGSPAAQGAPAEVSTVAASSPAATSRAEPDGETADNSVETAPSSTTQPAMMQPAMTQPAALSGDMAAANGADAPTTADAPGEYASSSGAAADVSSAATEYASSNSNRRYSSDYASNTYSTPYYTAAQTAAIQSFVAALGEPSPGAQPKTQSDGPAPVNAALGAAPAGGGTAGATRWSPSDLVVRSEMQAPLAIAAPSTSPQLGADDELAAPIALIAPDGDGSPPSPDETAMAWAFRFAPDAAPTPSQLAGLLAGPAAANLALIEQGVDALFERLDRLGGELAEKIGPRQCAHALLAAAGAAAAWEYARAWYRENEAGSTVDGRGPSELRLRRRWSLRRRGNL